MACELGLEVMYRKNNNFRNIQAEITRQAVEKRITPVIIIDEANHINNGVLNELKMLFNFEMDSRDRAVVLLVGLPPVKQHLTAVSKRTVKTADNNEFQYRITYKGRNIGIHKN